MKTWMKVLFVSVPVLLCAAAFARRSRAPSFRTIPAADEQERMAYLAACGREGELLSAQPVTVPEEDAVYAPYAGLQRVQLLPLSEHTGEAAMLYTYALQGSSFRAELLCADGILIGAQLYLPEDAKSLPLSELP